MGAGAADIKPMITAYIEVSWLRATRADRDSGMLLHRAVFVWYKFGLGYGSRLFY